MKNNNYLIIGASGHAGVIIDELTNLDQSINIELIDEDKNKSQLLGFPVIGNFEDFKKNYSQQNKKVIVGIGNNKLRSSLFDTLYEIDSVNLVNVISSDSKISKNVEIGVGNLIVSGAIINHSVKVGNNSIINTMASIDHDSFIGSNVHIAPGVNLAGNVKVGDNVLIGVGATILPNLKIGSNSIIGGGSVVIKDVSPGSTVIGNPAYEKK